MKVLVTGSSGMIGKFVCRELRRSGHEVSEFDLVHGQDIFNVEQIFQAMQNCQAVVHLAALLGEENQSSEDIYKVNLLGTGMIVDIASDTDVERIVLFSSLEVLGIFRGERAPDYLPIDDAHSCYPQSPYATSKHVSEQLLHDCTSIYGAESICLRLPGVFTAETYDFIREARRKNPEFEWHPFWQYGAFLDVRDAATAARYALSCPLSDHITLNLCADDISSSTLNSRELARLVCPEVEWRGGAEYDGQPFKALVDNQRAKDILGWQPQYKWRP